MRAALWLLTLCAACDGAGGTGTSAPGIFAGDGDGDGDIDGDPGQPDAGAFDAGRDVRGPFSFDPFALDGGPPPASKPPACDAGACVPDAGGDGDGDDGWPPALPESWSCPPEDFAALDGCDCGCGAPDPDCDVGCEEPGCRRADCDRCHDAEGARFECAFFCPPELRGDGVCDCGCGRPDPDCGGRGCTEAGCFADACEGCYDGDGAAIGCDPGGCAGEIFGDGVCDCGCRRTDPDCLGAVGCVGPGCSAAECGRCHGEGGGTMVCDGWRCGLEQQGADDGCSCGCGLPDPDCGVAGCAEPGCMQEGCTTCRDADGQPVGCEP